MEDGDSFVQWVIATHPRGGYAVQRWRVLRDGGEQLEPWAGEPTLELARATLPPGLELLSGDKPWPAPILEVWI